MEVETWVSHSIPSFSQFLLCYPEPKILLDFLCLSCVTLEVTGPVIWIYVHFYRL